jgi:dATP pyrophosphohydrolase
LEYCAFHRADCDQWQFVAGGGEDSETPWDAAKREVLEEGGVYSEQWIALDSLAYMPATVISEKHRRHWSRDIYVIPEYAFGFACASEIKLSHEHTEYVWLSYGQAMQRMKWDSNRTALYELNCRVQELLQ